MELGIGRRLLALPCLQDFLQDCLTRGWRNPDLLLLFAAKGIVAQQESCPWLISTCAAFTTRATRTAHVAGLAFVQGLLGLALTLYEVEMGVDEKRGPQKQTPNGRIPF